MVKRSKELDYLKGVLILLVITFHLVWFEQLHPDIKQVVYCFHMPGFLFIAGYLMNVGKAPRDFLRTLLWLAVPYLFMESGYIVMASLLPINDHIDCLTSSVFFDRLLLHPLGPPWFLHALMLCEATYYIIIYIIGERSKEQEKTSCPDISLAPCSTPHAPVCRVILTGIAYYILADGLGILSFSSALYFLAGAALRLSGTDFVTFFRPSKLSVVVFFLLACLSYKPTQASMNGALIAYFAISSLLAWPLLNLPKEQGARSKGQENTIEEQGARSKGQENTIEEQGARSKGQENTIEEQGARSKGQENTIEEQGARSKGQENTNYQSNPLASCPLPLAPKKRGPLQALLFLGRNSLMLYVFSPIFTVLCKRLVPLLQFDTTGLLFLVISLTICVAGSLAIAWAMDRTGIARFFFGRKAIMGVPRE